MRATHGFGWVVLCLVIVSVTVSGCRHSSDDDSNDNVSLSFHVIDTGGNFLVGRRVGVIGLPMFGTCTVGTIGTNKHITDAAITTAGQVNLAGTVSKSTFPQAISISLYVDIDANHVLSNGDNAWGPGGSSLAYFCFQSLTALQQLQEASLGAIGSLDYSNGSISRGVWSGGPQTY